MNKEDKIRLSEIYKKYRLRDDYMAFAINKDLTFDTREYLPVRFVISEMLRGEFAIVNVDLYRINRKSLTARPVYPDDFELVE